MTVHHARHGGKAPFMIRVYNERVRQLLKENRHDLLVEDRWADVSSCVIEAGDAAEARALALSRYPAEEGFVISAVAAMNGA